MDTELVEQVKQYAMDHYTDGWDVVAECYDDPKIAEMIGRATTLEEAIHELTPFVEIWADREADARNSVF